jgi:hypothetical protein
MPAVLGNHNTAELRAAWHQGRKELFYPYGQTYVQTLGEQDSWIVPMICFVTIRRHSRPGVAAVDAHAPRGSHGNAVHDRPAPLEVRWNLFAAFLGTGNST